jgi:hypothetical protein
MSGQIIGDTVMKYTSAVLASLLFAFYAGMHIYKGNITVAMLCVLGGIVSCILMERWSKNTSSFSRVFRPVVHVWKYDGKTRVMPQADWDLWHQVRERKRLAGILNDDEDERRPDSNILILFEDNPPENSWPVTGTMKQCQQLIKECDVRKSELHVYRSVVLDFPTAWKLVHGADSVPPEE